MREKILMLQCFALARAIYAGEDPTIKIVKFCILAAEDIGMADPMALVVANFYFSSC